MLLGINKVRIGVVDQERAKRFWVDTLGCELVQDASYGDERWLEVRLPDDATLILERHDGDPDDDTPRGQPNTPVFLACDDVDATWRELVERGVNFVQEPTDLFFGRWALFEDGQGNRFPLSVR
ncbi:VOC family protein [Haloactinomyces albus]|uniref:Enzyme related to lactoylglutathione lyase n=1 Tax=Haloactinomyces albus TaxID=1352928 RepID=A0AAE3Z9M3_9ACTN|nr:VOC family protein [Haloactinomyces albus]MDR7299825.1 putative enzyme related to lactoylglutathione lyase [Haloactinomyces albus]